MCFNQRARDRPATTALSTERMAGTAQAHPSMTQAHPQRSLFTQRRAQRQQREFEQRLRYEARQAKTLEWVRSFVAHLSSWRLPLNATDLHQGIIFAC